MNESPTFEGLTQQALEEHRQIHFYLDQISHALKGLTDDMTDVEPMRRLAARIEGLKERLVEHQQTEEDGGLFRAIVEALPACRVEIDRLANQHERIIEILELARLHALGGRVEDAASLREDFGRFLDMFRQHEEQEERLLSRALELEGSATS